MSALLDTLSSLRLESPARLWVLLLLVIVILAARVFRRPATRMTGTFQLWARVNERNEARGKRRRFALPLSTWLLVLGSCAARWRWPTLAP